MLALASIPISTVHSIIDNEQIKTMGRKTMFAIKLPDLGLPILMIRSDRCYVHCSNASIGLG